MPALVFIYEVPHEGVTYECSNCGAEYVVPENHDLPTECDMCGCSFEEVS